jgi:hypothetical protein
MTWNTNQEKLLCFVLMDDGAAQRLNVNAGPAYWRAFIVQNRKTGKITAKFRYKYSNGTRNWYEITPKPEDQANPEALVARLVASFEDIYSIALSQFGVNPADVMHAFYPPDDGGDAAKTIDWMKQQDLIEEPVFEKIEPEDGAQ